MMGGSSLVSKPHQTFAPRFYARIGAFNKETIKYPAWGGLPGKESMSFHILGGVRKAIAAVKFFVHLLVILSFLISTVTPASNAIAKTNSWPISGVSILKGEPEKVDPAQDQTPTIREGSIENDASLNLLHNQNADPIVYNAGGVSFSWDDNGNLLNDGVHAYSYDFANRLVAVGGQQSAFGFGYDGLGNRYQQTANGQTTTYTLDQAADLSQVLFDGTVSYYYGLGRISQQRNGVADYFLTDALGSVRQIANQSGSVRLGQAYDPFGNILGWSGQDGSSYGYAGEWTDASGLQYLRARYYSPAQGRFMTKDPFPGIMTQPASLTPYVYALNNPALLTDPSGEFVDTLFDIASLGYDIYTIGDKVNRGCALIWSDWASLGVDALSMAIPFIPAPGWAIRFAAHADDFGDFSRLLDKTDEIFKKATQLPLPGLENQVKEIPRQIHHLITNKGEYWPKIMRKITDNYKLDLNGDWNKVTLPGHKGKHTEQYHQWVYRQLRGIDARANGDTQQFLDLFIEKIKKPVLENPRLPYMP
jgi:RHS repeat-associated protein